MSNRVDTIGRIMAHWSSRRQSTTTSSALPVRRRGSAARTPRTMSTESGGTVLLGAVEPGAVVPADEAREVLAQASPAACGGRPAAPARRRAPSLTSHSASSAISSTHSRQAMACPRRVSSSRNRVAKSRESRCWRMRSPSSSRVTTERICRGLTGLIEVIADLGADGVLERLLFLALGDHHDRHASGPPRGWPGKISRPRRPGICSSSRTTPYGLALQQHQRVVAVRRLVDREAVLLEEEDVGREALDLVVHPEDALGAGHGAKLTAAKRSAQRWRPHPAAAYIPAVPDTGSPGAPRILLVRFSSIGDILLTTPLIRALRARHPGGAGSTR